MKIWVVVILVFLYAKIIFANANPCELVVGDGSPKVVEHSIQFRGPYNGFWHYVSGDPSTWSFEIVSVKKPKVKKPSFERIYIRRTNSSFVDFGKNRDVVYLPNNRFTFAATKIDDFINQSSETLKSIKKEKPISIPTAREQAFEISFEAITSSEDWLNYDCWIGFGPNSISGRLATNDGKGIPHFTFTIQVNNPSLEGSPLKDKISVQTDSQGTFQLNGLPMYGTFIADLPTPNKKVAIASFSGISEKCDWEIRKESAANAGWVVTKNTCAQSSTPSR